VHLLIFLEYFSDTFIRKSVNALVSLYWYTDKFYNFCDAAILGASDKIYLDTHSFHYNLYKTERIDWKFYIWFKIDVFRYTLYTLSEYFWLSQNEVECRARRVEFRSQTSHVMYHAWLKPFVTLKLNSNLIFTRSEEHVSCIKYIPRSKRLANHLRSHWV